MEQTEPSTKIQSTTQLGGVIAWFACLACTAYLLCVVSPAVESLGAPWAELLVYTLIPIGLTFTILHGSNIHREMTRTVRASYLFLISCLIFGGTFLFIGALVFCACAFPGGGRTGP